MKAKSFSRVRLLAAPWTAAYQAPLLMGFSRQEYWSESPVPSPLVLPGESHEQRSQAGYSPWGCKESDTTEVTEHAYMHWHKNISINQWKKKDNPEINSYAYSQLISDKGGKTI